MDIDHAMEILNLEVNNSFEKQTSEQAAKRAAIIIQRTVRHWLKK